MELNKKIQELRTQKGLTQEDLAEILFVSRTAISKWESGRGYPNIDSLKAISEYFSVTIDELLSSKELLSLAQKDSATKTGQIQDLVFGLLDLSFLLLLFIPLFGQPDGDFIKQVSLLSLEDNLFYVKVSYFIVVLVPALFGVILLALQSWENHIWIKSKRIISLVLSIVSVLVFIATREPYAATFSFALLVIKGILALKRE